MSAQEYPKVVQIVLILEEGKKLGLGPSLPFLLCYKF